MFLSSHTTREVRNTLLAKLQFSRLSVCGYTVKNEKLNNLLGSHIRPCQCLCGLKFIITQWANIVFIISHHAGGQKCTFGQTALFSPSVCGYTVKNEKLNNLLGSHIRPFQCLCGLKFIITQWANIVFIISHHEGGQKYTFGQTALISCYCSFVLNSGGTMGATVTGARENRRGNGMEVTVQIQTEGTKDIFIKSRIYN